MSFKLIEAPRQMPDGLFSSPGWLSLLRDGFGCQCVHVHDAKNKVDYPIAVFKAGPFRVAYIAFPVGAALGSVDRYQQLAACLRGLHRSIRPHCLRASVSGFDEQPELDLNCAETPETAIVDLPTWTLGLASSNVRRDLKRARKADLAVREASPEDSKALYVLYADTIKRNQGSLRYNVTYFEKLVALASVCEDLKVLASGPVGAPAAFVAAARHNEAGYYLHGGSDPAQRQHRPAALLMHEAISWAQNHQCRLFNFMSSPPDQPSLVQYKEKWAGTTRTHRTYSFPIRRTYPLFRAAEFTYKLLGRA